MWLHISSNSNAFVSWNAGSFITIIFFHNTTGFIRLYWEYQVWTHCYLFYQRLKSIQRMKGGRKNIMLIRRCMSLQRCLCVCILYGPFFFLCVCFDQTEYGYGVNVKRGFKFLKKRPGGGGRGGSYWGVAMGRLVKYVFVVRHESKRKDLSTSEPKLRTLLGTGRSRSSS